MQSAYADREWKKADLFQVPDLDDVVEWIAGHLEVGDVFSEKQLATWAQENGYHLDDEDEEN